VPSGLDLDRCTAARAFGNAYFNLIRRGADGSLKMSMDHWQLVEVTAEAFHFQPKEDGVDPLEVRVAEIERLTWDRLPRQQVRSQIRFYLANGDLWTFSGSVDESALPDRSGDGD
jgi:hypothetical protein